MSPAAEKVSLYGTEGYVLESPEGDLGWIEEVVVGDENVPVALTVRTIEGWRGRLRGEDVLAVDREYHWVVVPPEPSLEADSGEVRHAHARRPKPLPLPWRRLRQRWSRSTADPRLWTAIVAELTFIAFLVLAVVALAFLVARLVTGAAY